MAENEYNRNEEEDLSQVEGMAEGKVKEGVQNIKEAANTIKRVKGKKNPEDDESEKEGSEDGGDSDSDADAGEKNGDSSGSEKDDNDTDKNDDSSKDDTEGKDDAENGIDSTDRDTGTDESKTSPSGAKSKPEGEQNNSAGEKQGKADDGKEPKSGHDSNDKQSNPGETPVEGAADDGFETNQSKKNLSNSQKGQGAESGPDRTGNEKRQRSLQDKKNKNEKSSGGKAKAKSEGNQGSKSGKNTASKSGKKSAKKGSKKSEKASGEATKKIWGWLVSAFGVGGAIIFVLCAFLLIIIGVIGVIAAAVGNSSGGSVGGTPLSGSAAQRLVQIAHQEKGKTDRTKYGASGGEAWCGYYAGWLLDQIGIRKEDFGWSPGVGTWCDNLTAKHLFFVKEQYTPSPGDIIIFGSANNRQHVGIVIEVKDGKVTTSEGNTVGGGFPSVVWEHERLLTDSYIYGYGKVGTSGSGSGTAVSNGNFVPRLTCPESNDRHYFSNENIFYASGYGMPNCTAYAYGRAYELMGTTPDLSPKSAQYWFDYNKNNHIYEYGSEPRLGAILCMERAGGGHVAVVEKIEPDGTITTSESAWNGTMFYTLTRQKGYYQYDDRYTVQGFIYIPVAGGASSAVSSYSYDEGFNEFARQLNAWMGNGGSSLGGNLNIAGRTNYDQQQSINRVYQLLRQYGFSKAVACGIMGNIMGECSFDQNTYFAGYVPDADGAPGNSGGICMWYADNCDRFRRDCPNWGTSLDAQVEYLCKTLELNADGELSPSEKYSYGCSGCLPHMQSCPNSKAGAMSAARIFMLEYERPNTSDSSLRESYAAEYWDTMTDSSAATITNGGLH